MSTNKHLWHTEHTFVPTANLQHAHILSSSSSSSCPVAGPQAAPDMAEAPAHPHSTHPCHQRNPSASTLTDFDTPHTMSMPAQQPGASLLMFTDIEAAFTTHSHSTCSSAFSSDQYAKHNHSWIMHPASTVVSVHQHAGNHVRCLPPALEPCRLGRLSRWLDLRCALATRKRLQMAPSHVEARLSSSAMSIVYQYFKHAGQIVVKTSRERVLGEPRHEF